MAQGKVRIEGISKTFDESNLVLDAISFDVVEGSLTCLLGPSGCGKSTLLSMVAGFVRPSRGRVIVDAVEVTAPSADRGIVFQDYALFPWRTAVENVMFGPKVRGLRKKECREIALHYLAMVGLEDHVDKLPRQLSGGMKQRVAIARALANRPSVLLMDEPFGALDALTRQILQEELLRIWLKERTTIIFVTHSIRESVYLATSIVAMTRRPGRVKEFIPVTLPYPRDPTSAEFLQIERRVDRLIRDEVGN
jgi:NitT/TauT family transport system ATP-binding protein